MKKISITINGTKYNAVDIPAPSDASKMILCFECHLQQQCKTLPMSVIDICHKAIGNKVFKKDNL